jgi:peptidoglycan/LPS O-acetylase OafA/YrhL
MQYRSEIDGLRAIAVLPVVLFHAEFSLFSGGFVGVDVFFVISGYLITTLLLNDLEQGHFSLVRFYERRARRILPSLFLVMLVSTPVAAILMLPSQFADFAKSLIAVSLFSSNILFWRQSGYFEGPADEKPLLHTWSLAVEEQFYLLFPLFMLLFWRYGRRWLFTTLLLVTATSFLLSEWGWRYEPNANFYLAPTRAWELAVGSIAAFLLKYRTIPTNDALAALGLGLILFGVFAYDAHTPFPSVYTLVPVVGTALIVLYGRGDAWIARLLSWRLFVGIGLISYSLYLWHQPLFAFARIRVGDPSLTLMLVLIGVSAVLAVLSWKYVEVPIRRRPTVLTLRPWRVFRVSGVFMAGFILVGIGGVGISSSAIGLSERERFFLSFLHYTSTSTHTHQYRSGSCFYESTHGDFEVAYDKDKCLNFSTDRPNFVMVGDSYAAHLWRALDETYDEINIMQATAAGCRPLRPYAGARRCTKLVEYVFEEVVRREDVDGVILSGRWEENDLDRIAETVAYLEQWVETTVVLGLPTEFVASLPEILAYTDMEAATTPEDWRRYVDQDRQTFARRFTAAAAAADVVVDLTSCVCDDDECRILTEDGAPVAYDYAHFTLDAAREVATCVRRRYGPLTDETAAGA